MPLRFPRTIRLDGTDTRIFERAAEPGEWAVTGAFAFADKDPSDITGKQRQAFRNGFLGLDSFGWSTLVTIASIDDAQYEDVINRLAGHFVSHFGAPDVATALPVAREEAAFAASLCDHPVNTVLAVDRDHGDDGIIERFRVVEQNMKLEDIRIWEIVEDD
jgi:hypothetical protein